MSNIFCSANSDAIKLWIIYKRSCCKNHIGNTEAGFGFRSSSCIAVFCLCWLSDHTLQSSGFFLVCCILHFSPLLHTKSKKLVWLYFISSVVLHSKSSSWSWEHFYSLHIPISDLWGFATSFHICFWVIHFSMTFRKSLYLLQGL